MREFLYFFADPAIKALDKAAWRELMAAHDLAYLRHTIPVCRECLSGPSGTAGLVVAARRDGAGPPPAYKPGDQLWRRCGDVLWIGVGRDAMPTPGDLEQPSLLEGHAVELADGNDWLMPRALLAPGGQTGLELVLTVDPETGEDAEMVRPCYRRFGDLARRFFEACLGADNDRVTFALDDLTALATEGLGHNYRVGIHELRILGALSTDNLWRLAFAAIDGPRYNEMLRELGEAQKKTGVPSESTG